jgi:Tfp pilus assembly protein FimT
MYKQTNKGYSIVEMLVYLAIFTTVSIFIINSMIVVLGSFATTRTNRDLLESGSITMERISREIRQSKSVDIVNSTLGSSPGVLQLNSTDSARNAMIVKFIVSSGALNLYENGTSIGNLLGQNVSVSSLIFRRIATTNGEAVKIELTLQDTYSKNNQSQNFYNTIILRGEY